MIQLPLSSAPAKREATKLREMLGNAAEEVENISRTLRPGVLKELGLLVVLRATTEEFAERTGVSVQLSCVPLPERLPYDTELTIYRILLEALKNVEQHAQAHQVTVRLTKPKAAVQLVIHDDGIGFNPEDHTSQSKGEVSLGLLSMRERAMFSGGTLKVKSVRRNGRKKAGTAIEVRIPLES